MFAPSGRPLKGGQGYFSNLWLFFPGVTYAFTDNISIMGGMFIWFDPDALGELIYTAPMVGHNFSDSFGMTVGTLYLKFPEAASGIAFGTLSIGKPGSQFSCGLGFGYHKNDGGKFRFSDKPVLMVGANIHINDTNAIVLENWQITSFENPGHQPYAIVHRIMRKNTTFDMGFIFAPARLNDAGFPRPFVSFLPWTNFTWNFGR